MSSFAIVPIRIYRKYLSPLKRRPSCRFLPTCSEYAEQAVTAHGLVSGGWMAIRRIFRCNPLFRGGYDPVPIPVSGGCGSQHERLGLDSSAQDRL